MGKSENNKQFPTYNQVYVCHKFGSVYERLEAKITGLGLMLMAGRMFLLSIAISPRFFVLMAVFLLVWGACGMWGLRWASG